MNKAIFLAALLAPAFLGVSARAANPALVAGVEKYLRDDEKALLAALLTHPDLSAEFDATAPFALKDPKNLGPFLGAWRGRLVAFAETDGKRPNPNLDAPYSNHAKLMTVEQRAFVVRRLPTMKEDDRNTVIGYLKEVNAALAKNGALTYYTKKVVEGVLDKYRLDLTTYAQTPIAQSAKRDAAASSAAFASLRQADEESRRVVVKAPPSEVDPGARVKPVPADDAAVTGGKPSATTPIVVADAGAVVTVKPGGGAIDQAQAVVNAGDQGGRVVDGAKVSPDGDVVVAPIGGTTGAPSLAPSTPGEKADLAAAVPSPVSPEADFMDSVQKMQTKDAPPSMIKRLAPFAVGAVGALLGGLIGFLFGGPIGALIGAAVGAGAGYLAGKVLVNKLLQ